MCSLTDADARQAFMDILANDVIRPLEILKVSKEEYLVSEGIPVLMARKDLNNKTREWIDKGLKISATCYADHAETRVSKLQQGYLRKYQPQRYGSSAKVLQHPQFVPNKRFENKGLETADPSGEGITDVIHGFQLDLLSHPSASVSDDDCREAVTLLNRFRLLRAEELGEGYNVSYILFYNIY